MAKRSDHFVLIAAFALAIALHAAVLPWVGAAVGGRDPQPTLDLVVKRFQAEQHARAGHHFGFEADVFEVEGEVSSRKTRRDRVDAVWLSQDANLDANDQQLETLEIPGIGDVPRDDIEVEQIIHATKLPQEADGPYWLIYQADIHEEVPDRDRSNNTRAVPIFIDGPQTPELSIENFDAPDRAATGGSVFIDFTVKNSGQGWAASGLPLSMSTRQPHWTDRVYLSDDATLDETDTALRALDRNAPLAPGDDYRHASIELAIPREASGKMHLILVADADQVLDQPSFTAGVAVRAIEVVDSASPDLVVASIDQPDRLVINRATPVTFSVANLGSGATAGSAWADGLYLSRDAVLDDQSVPIALAPAGQPLQPRSRYDATASVTLPESIEPGPWFLIVKTDAQDAIDEGEFEANNALAVPVMVLTEQQADAEIQLGNPDRPERLVVQWIEHDRLEEHRARLSRTTQPALQDKADPVPDAPLNFNPQPPAVASTRTNPAGDPANPQRTIDPSNQQDARPDPSATDATQSDLAPRPQQPGTQPTQRIDGLPGDEGDLNPQRPGIDRPDTANPEPIDPTPGDGKTPSPEPGDRRVDSPADPTAPNTDRTTDSPTPAETVSDTDSKNPKETDTKQPTDQPKPTESDRLTTDPETNKPAEQEGEGDADEKQTDRSTTDKPADDQQPQPDGREADPTRPSEDQTPTRAPRDDSEAPPVSVEKLEVALQEGRVLVGKGIKVTTKLPTPPGTGARRLSLPRNARVRVTFTSDGKVYEAKVIKSTTYAEWDAAIEASLYRWQAEGEAVDNAEPYIAIEWNYLLNDLFEGE